MKTLCKKLTIVICVLTGFSAFSDNYKPAFKAVNKPVYNLHADIKEDLSSLYKIFFDKSSAVAKAEALKANSSEENASSVNTL